MSTFILVPLPWDICIPQSPPGFSQHQNLWIDTIAIAHFSCGKASLNDLVPVTLAMALTLTNQKYILIFTFLDEPSFVVHARPYHPYGDLEWVDPLWRSPWWHPAVWSASQGWPGGGAYNTFSMQTTGEYLQSGFSILKSKLFLLQVFHYWVDQPGGQQRSENATLITGEQPPTVLHLITKDKDIMAKDKHTELVIRPELNCLYQEEEELTIALNGHYHFPPPEKPTQNSIIIENTAKGTIGESHYRSLQDEFLDEFIFN